MKRVKGIASSRLRRKQLHAQIHLNAAVDYLKRPFVTATLMKNKEKEKKALSYAMLCAERLTRMKAYKVIIDILVDEAARFPERRALAQRFIRNYLPEMKKEAEFIRSGDSTTLAYINGLHKE